MMLLKHLLIACACCLSVWQTGAQEVTDCVNPLIGTDRSDVETVWGKVGGVYPGAVSPWGAVQLSPETRPAGGYFYSDSTIRYFTCIGHASGYPHGSTGRIQVTFATGTIDSQALPSKQTYSHSNEQAQAGYYAVRFDEGSQIEMTTTTRTGMFRYYPTQAPYTVTIAGAGKIELLDNKTVAVSAANGRFLFNRPWTSQQLSAEGRLTLQFDELPGKDGLLVKAGFSSVSPEGSILNLNRENPAWDFDALRTAARQEWEKELSVVKIETEHPEDAVKFYTALYHTFLYPNIISDVDGQYRGYDNRIHRTKRANVYGWFSPWDTFRTLHPLLSLLKPARQLDMIHTLLDRYDQTGNLPFYPMTGYHSLPIIIDSYTKGITDFDTAKAYQAMRKCLIGNELPRRDTYTYIQTGFLNDTFDESVSKTLDYAYNDWTLSVFADLSGHSDDGSLLRERSLNYRHLFDTETQFMLPRNESGFIRNPGEMGYKESDKWTATWFVPHNVQDLINLMGGDTGFTNHLQEAMEKHVIFDNETVFHYPYLFSFAGRPDLTCQWINHIRETNFRTTPGGIPGNDDLGAMSAWYVFSALGFYPVCPGRPEYVLTTPLFPSAILSLENGKTMHITADKETIHHPFSGLKRNEQAYQKLFITHSDLTAGGTFRFHGKAPLIDYTHFQRPSSITDATPQFQVKQPVVAYKKAKANQENELRFTVVNTGAAGTFSATVKENDHIIAQKKVFVEQGATVTDSLPFRLYAEGKHHLSFDNYTLTTQVTAGKAVPPHFAVQVKEPVVRQGENISVEIAIQNISSKSISGQFPVYVGDSEVETVSYRNLNPGETTVIALPVTISQTGLHTLKVMEQTQTVKVYDQPAASCVLSMDFEKLDKARVYDTSGLDNHGVIHGNVTRESRGQSGAIGFNGDGYIELPLSESLDITGQTLTLAAWVYPTEAIAPNSNRMDFLSKGDYNVFQVSARNFAFFAGSWGRGVVSFKLPADWTNHWHHITGVCNGNELKLYLNGELQQALPIEGTIKSTEIPWNIGRNAEIPHSRNFKGMIDEVRIFTEALSDEEVKNLYQKQLTIKN
ncbi:hypothetical protein FACS1894145_6590 [Bacteroidia bacterium]|nr:hypothetical protein FACS1894145_6590 [Bacteroidia bacterium]